MCASITKLNFSEFTNYYRRCAGPLRRHKNDVQRSLNEITLEEFRYLMKFYQDKNYVFVVKRKILLRKKKMRM